MGDDNSNEIKFGDDWGIKIPICDQPGRQLDVFDANGDDLYDMVCTYSTGYVQIAEGHIVPGDTFNVTNVQDMG